MDPFMTVVMLGHAMTVFIPWTFAIYLKSPTLIMISFTLNLLTLIQFVVFGGCLATAFETPGAEDSFIMTGLAAATRTPVDAVKSAFTLINSAAPMFMELSKIAGLLRV